MKDEQKNDTKETILENAISLFASKGYDGVGVQEICTVSNITKPTLYYYFSSKSGLLNAIVSTFGENFYSTLKNACDYNHDFIGSLTKILTSTIEFAKQNPYFFTLHCSLTNASSQSEGGQIYFSFSKRIEELFIDFFGKSVNEIGNMKGKEKLFAKMFQKVCMSTAQEISNEKSANEDSSNSNQDLNQISYTIIRAFAYGVVNG